MQPHKKLVLVVSCYLEVGSWQLLVGSCGILSVVEGSVGSWALPLANNN